MAVGCSSNDEPTFVAGQPVMVDFAYTFSSSTAGNTTRQATEVVQLNNSSSVRLPGSNNLHIIPTIGDTPAASNFQWSNEPVSKTDPRSMFYYNSCSISDGVNQCLVYGGTNPIGNGTKVYNGSLVEPFPATLATAADLNNIKFSLDPIYPGNDAHEDAIAIANVLTTMANDGVWSKPAAVGNKVFVDLRNSFIMYVSDDFKDIPGSKASAKQWLLALASDAYRYYSNPPSIVNNDACKALLLEVKENATTLANDMGDITSTSFPRNINLPDGAAALRWNATDNKFEPKLQTTTLDDINSVSRFAYPASLYYFIKSGIRTSNKEVDYKIVYGEVESPANPTKTAWERVLDNFTDGPTVSSGTKSIALEKPVQYAVGQLKVNVKAEGGNLPDALNANINISNNFLLTGVIVCGQRPVDFEFKQPNNSDEETKFIYDSQVVSACYLKEGSSYLEACNTLVLQSYQGENVNIILEFENVSNTLTFKCSTGYVYPHTRFYLIGEVKAPTGEAVIENQEQTKHVFTKDYITTLNMNVKSLAKAYNALPNLLTSYLEIGVETTPDWIASTPTIIRLE